MLHLLEDEQKYKQSSTVSIRHGIGDSLCLDGLTRRSTVAEVVTQLINKLQLDRHTDWTIIEKWRGTEKVLPSRTRILRVWHAWCSEQVNVEFWLSKSKSTFSHSSNRRYGDERQHRKKRKESDWCDTDSMTSDSSESSFVDSLSGSTSSEDSDVEEQQQLKGDNVQRQQLIRLLESQSVQIQRNVKHGKQLQHELDEVDCLTLLESIELTQHQVEVIEQKNASVEMELAGFEHLIAEADCVAHYDDHARRNCLHEVISRQLILNKRLSDEMAQLEHQEREIEAQIASQTASLQLLLEEEDEGQPHVKTQLKQQLTNIEQNVDADNESSDTEQRSSERLNSFDSWDQSSDDHEEGSQSSSSGGDSGLPEGDSSTSYSEDSDNLKNAESETGSINTSDSALSSMHNSDDATDYTRYKTIKKKRVPDWWHNQNQEQNQDQSKDYLQTNHLAELASEAAHTNNLDLSCDDDAPFGNSEYIKKIRAKNAKMANLGDQHQFLSSSNSQMYRSASTRRRVTQFGGAQCQSTNNLQTTRLKRSQSLKTVETLV